MYSADRLFQLRLTTLASDERTQWELALEALLPIDSLRTDKPLRILDAGTGTGFLALLLAGLVRNRSFRAPTGRGQDNRQTSEATECRSGVPQSSYAAEDKSACAELVTGRADGAIQDNVRHRMWQDDRQTSEATECRSGVPQSYAAEDKSACAELVTGCADGAVIVGIDSSPAMVQCAYEAAAVAGHRIEYRIMDCTRMDFDDESFDVIVCCELLSELNNPNAAWAEFRRVLKPKGHLIAFDSAAISVEQAQTQGFSHCRIKDFVGLQAIERAKPLRALTAMKPAKSERHMLPQAALLKQHISIAKKQIQLYQSCCQKLGMAYPDYTVLNMLSYHPKGSRPTDIAAALAIQPQTLTRILAAMRELGYINRQTQENDHRSAVITITDAGAAKIKPLQSALQAIEEKALASFSIDEMTKLSEISSKLLDELSKEFKNV